MLCSSLSHSIDSLCSDWIVSTVLLSDSLILSVISILQLGPSSELLNFLADYLWLCRVFCCCLRAFSSYAQSGSYSSFSVQASDCGGFCCRTQAIACNQLQVAAACRLSNCMSWAPEHGPAVVALNCCLKQVCGIFPRRGIEPVSLTLSGRFLNYSHQRNLKFRLLYFTVLNFPFCSFFTFVYISLPGIFCFQVVLIWKYFYDGG